MNVSPAGCRILTIAALCFSPAYGQYTGSAPPPRQFTGGFESITEANSEALLKVLAGDEFAGRGTGQEGFLKAAKWFAGKLEESGFQPGGPDGSWFQTIPFVRTDIIAAESGLSVGESEVVKGAQLGVSDFFGTSELSLPVSFVRITGKPPKIADGQFKDRILVIQSVSRIRTGNKFLAKAKADAVLIVSRESRVRSQSVFQQSTPPGTKPAVQIGAAAANNLAAACGLSGSFFTEESPKENLIVSSSRVTHCKLNVSRESVDVPNVVGWYPGSDESLRHEHVCIGAHLDHLGVQKGDVYPGADDNGSGSTSILQIANAINSNSVKPKRSVLLIAFCAEERGLLGSKHYAANPVYPIKDMVCMLNIDMIGRNEESDTESASDNINTIHLVGSKKISMELHNLTMDANKSVNFVFEYDQEGVYTRSDHASFAKQGVPITFLFGGFTPRYHKPTDTLEGINYAKIANCARLNYLTLMMAAEHGHFEKNKVEDKKEKQATPDNAAPQEAVSKKAVSK